MLIAPMSQQRIAHDEGELAVARAAAAEGICMVTGLAVAQGGRLASHAPCRQQDAQPEISTHSTLRLLCRMHVAIRRGVTCVQVQSTMSTVPLAEVREAGRGAPLMLFQLYVFRDRAFTQRLVQRACAFCSLSAGWHYNVPSAPCHAHAPAVLAFAEGFPATSAPG